MSGLLRYAWNKRNKIWLRRGFIAGALGRGALRKQYRIAGYLRSWLGKSGAAESEISSLRTAANPFIEFENGLLGLKPAPIATTLRESYSQCNEDIIVESILRAIFVQSNRPMSTLRYLEIGGNHPVQTSSTYLFYRAWGAHGYLVEANAELADRLVKVRPRDVILNTAVSDKEDKALSLYIHDLDELSTLSAENVRESDTTGLPGTLSRVETVPNLHINELLRSHIRTDLDFMSIDIEGLDLPVLKAMDPMFRPTVLQVECADETLRQELCAVLEPRNYRLSAITDVNLIFVKDERP